MPCLTCWNSFPADNFTIPLSKTVGDANFCTHLWALQINSAKLDQESVVDNNELAQTETYILYDATTTMLHHSNGVLLVVITPNIHFGNIIPFRIGLIRPEHILPHGLGMISFGLDVFCEKRASIQTPHPKAQTSEEYERLLSHADSNQYFSDIPAAHLTLLQVSWQPPQ